MTTRLTSLCCNAEFCYYVGAQRLPGQPVVHLWLCSECSSSQSGPDPVTVAYALQVAAGHIARDPEYAGHLIGSTLDTHLPHHRLLREQIQTFLSGDVGAEDVPVGR